MADDDLAAEMKELADSAVQMAVEVHNLLLDFSTASVPVLEVILLRAHERHARADLQPQELTGLTYTCGAYLGEVIRRAVGGNWERVDAKQVALSAPTVLNGRRARVRLNTLTWCYKHITIGSSEAVSQKMRAGLTALGSPHPAGEGGIGGAG